MKVARITFFFFVALLLTTTVVAQTLVVNAGNNTIICPGTTATIGGAPTATGGTPPYTYSWTPATNLSSTTVSNPIANPTAPIYYFVTVTDALGNTDYDSVGVNLYPIYAYNGGPDISICIGSSGTLGGPNNSLAGGSTYTWTPASGLDNPSAPNPVTSTTVTTTYSVTITSPNCASKQYTVTVTVNPLPVVTACCATTIYEGQTANLLATGAVLYSWGPSATISNPYTAATTAEPITTTLYYVFGEDANGCQDWDSLTVTVIPSSEIVFYNTFSPNGDGVNDWFYIGNAYKYPQCRLEVYTRTGQLVYAKTGYDNSWDGTNYGDKLPEATYYYVFTPGDGTETKYGYVTILR